MTNSMKIESKIGKAEYSSERIYNFIADFRNFNNFIPEDKVSNWSAEKDKCSFKIDMLGNIGLYMLEKQPHKLIKICGDPAVKQQHDLTLWIQIKEIAENDCRIKVTIEPKVNQIMLSMVKGPLKKFVDQLVDEIEGFTF